MMKNIGILNALFRIACGLTILAWCTAKMVKRPWKESYVFLAFLGAMKVGEGILQYCPVTDFVENREKFLPLNSNENQGEEKQHREEYNI